MKDPEALNIQSADFFRKVISHNHSMQKMTEYYSKTPMGGCGKSRPPQEALLDTFKCHTCKNSIVNKYEYNHYPMQGCLIPDLTGFVS